ncbi:MAG: UDP-3-O-acyl-N-acetylglucosamine deacetylase [Cyanobium sp.]
MIWPGDYSHSWTLAGPVQRRGIGLHSGEESCVRLQSGSRPGYWVGWLEDPTRELQRLHPGQVQDARLCTSLRLGTRKLATVEHLLAALAGTGVNQAEIWVAGEEIPLLDGSALPWVEAIAEAGLSDLGPREVPALCGEAITVRNGQSFVLAMEADSLQLSAAIEFPQPAIGRQLHSLKLTPRTFVEEIAPARTFGFRDQVEALLQAGLIRGGALANALVCDGETWLNPPLRFADEPVRHKLLDLIGDLALAGLPQAQVFAYRGSHGLHTALAAALESRVHDGPPIASTT